MKVSRFKVAVLVLLAVTVIYPVALHLDIQRYEAWKQAELEKYPQWASIMDFNPYGTTFTGALLISIAATLVICWVWVVVVKTHRKKLKSAMLMVLMFTVVVAFTPRAHAGYDTIVDVLAVQDEEFRFLYPAGWQRDLGWGIYIDAAFGRFEEEFGMDFELRGWIDWDSTDYKDSLYDLLDEAIRETNFESHVTTYNGYKIDILMVFTGEPQSLRPGFSPPEWKALIIYALPDAPRGRVVQHELSHQFYAEHCGNDCIMNLAKWEPGQWVPDYWCGQCTTTINDNKDRFWRWILTQLSISAGYGGTTSPAPGTYTYDYGTTVRVSAWPGWPSPPYKFDYWVLDGARRYETPITVTMDSDHTLKAYFKYSGGGGDNLPCPTLFVWNGSDYNDLGVIDIHADEDVVREVSVPSESVGVNEHKAQFRLREGWEGLTYSHSEIDQVKLYAVDSDGNQRLCPLVDSAHSELGNVLPRLLLSDDTRIDLYLLETIDLEFVVPWQTDEIEDFAFVIEGCNMVKM